MIVLLIVVSAILGFVIIYNLGILSFTEKQYQFATLKVLGFKNKQIKNIFAGAIAQNTGITMAGAFALAVRIAIQNFPEGAIISMPSKSEDASKPKAFLYGALSGIVEPIGALITILLTNAVVTILPYLLSFAAGAMIYVVVEELIPESQAGEHSNIGTIGVAIGFTIMMILNVALR